MGCFSVPGGKGADGIPGAETAEVGIQWAFMGFWAAWLEQKGDFRGRGRTFLFISSKLYFKGVRVKPSLLPLFSSSLYSARLELHTCC